MQTMIPLAALAVLAAIMAVFVKEGKMPVLALLIPMAAGIVLFLRVLPQLGEIFRIFQQLTEKAGLNQFYLATVLKIMAIAYLAEFCGQICRDANQNALATKVEFVAKVLVMAMALPIMVAVLESVLQLLP